MDGLFTLLSLCAVMATASFLAGILPLAFSLSTARLRMISTIGMGVLVGTSLVVIIPEGVETLYSASEVGHKHSHALRDAMFVHSASDQLSELHTRWLIHPARTSGDAGADPFDVPGPVIPSNMDDPPRTPTEPDVVGIMGEEHDADLGSEKDAGSAVQPDKGSQHAWIGIALLVGFMLMYLIDKVPQYSQPSKPRTRTHHIALNNLGRRFNMATSLDGDEAGDAFLGSTQGSQIQRSFATTIGLVIHAAADGIALGASSTATNSALSIVIFFAIMIHKAPAAFGLTSVLIKQGLSKRAARGHLLLFSLAAPAGAIITWILANVLGGGKSHSPETTTWWTGMLLLFSAGTFLYVAMHSMQETSNFHHEGANGQPNGYIEGRETSQNGPKPSWRDLAAACFGMVLPIFLQVGHAH